MPVTRRENATGVEYVAPSTSLREFVSAGLLLASCCVRGEDPDDVPMEESTDSFLVGNEPSDQERQD
jgi:hypothetical protein